MGQKGEGRGEREGSCSGGEAARKGKRSGCSLPFVVENTFVSEVLVREDSWRVSVWVFVGEASTCGCVVGQGVHMCSRGAELYTGVERGGNIKVISFPLYPW